MTGITTLVALSRAVFALQVQLSGGGEGGGGRVAQEVREVGLNRV